MDGGLVGEWPVGGKEEPSARGIADSRRMYDLCDGRCDSSALLERCCKFAGDLGCSNPGRHLAVELFDGQMMKERRA